MEPEPAPPLLRSVLRLQVATLCVAALALLVVALAAGGRAFAAPPPPGPHRIARDAALLREVYDALRSRPGAWLVDLGAGGGHASLLAASLLGSRVRAVDRDPTRVEDLARAAALHRPEGTLEVERRDLVEGDASRIVDEARLGSSFAPVLRVDLPSVRGSLAEAARAVRTGRAAVAVAEIAGAGGWAEEIERALAEMPAKLLGTACEEGRTAKEGEGAAVAEIAARAGRCGLLWSR